MPRQNTVVQNDRRGSDLRKRRGEHYLEGRGAARFSHPRPLRNLPDGPGDFFGGGIVHQVFARRRNSAAPIRPGRQSARYLGAGNIVGSIGNAPGNGISCLLLRLGRYRAGIFERPGIVKRFGGEPRVGDDSH